MKKTSKNVLFIVIGILVAFTIDVAAEAVISSGSVSYSNTTVSAALDELFSAVDINKKIGTTDISTIGDGTITGVISTQQNSIEDLQKGQVLYSDGQIHAVKYGNMIRVDFSTFTGASTLKLLQLLNSYAELYLPLTGISTDILAEAIVNGAYTYYFGTLMYGGYDFYVTVFTSYPGLSSNSVFIRGTNASTIYNLYGSISWGY